MGLFPDEIKDIEAALLAEPIVPVADVTAGVWSLPFPETRAATEELWAARPHLFYERAWNGGQGRIPEIFLAEWLRWSRMPLRDGFPWAYAAAGASEGIRELIEPGMRVNVFRGEYEGYKKIAEAKGCPVREHARSADATDALYGVEDVFWISDPSSIDGQHWLNIDLWIANMHERHPHVRIYIDLAYVGTMEFPIRRRFGDYSNVEAVVFSASKPLGMYYHRIGGVFSRTEVPTMYGNRWFFNPFSAALAILLMRRHEVTYLPKRYRPMQERMLVEAIARGDVPRSAKMCGCVLLARSKEGSTEFERAPGTFRFCLSPGMYREIEKET